MPDYIELLATRINIEFVFQMFQMSHFFTTLFFLDSLSSGEPRHIIYEIQMRRPVQENVYTLD